MSSPINRHSLESRETSITATFAPATSASEGSLNGRNITPVEVEHYHKQINELIQINMDLQNQLQQDTNSQKIQQDTNSQKITQLVEENRKYKKIIFAGGVVIAVVAFTALGQLAPAFLTLAASFFKSR